MMRMLSRRMRQRLSPAARTVTIRPHLAWYWRAAGAALLLTISVAGGLWLYELGRQFAGYDSSSARAERASLRERIGELEVELNKLRALTDSSDSRLQVEKTALGQLSRQVKILETENARLKEELAFFENLLPGGREDRLSIYRFRVEESGVPGEYRYRLLVMNGGGKEPRDFQGSLQLVVNVERASGSKVLSLPEGRASGEGFKLNFKRVQRVEGLFRVEPQDKVKTVQVRVLENGSAQPRATESFTLS